MLERLFKLQTPVQKEMQATREITVIQMIPTPIEWDLIQQLLVVMKPFHEATCMLIGEYDATIADAYPILWTLKNDICLIQDQVRP